MTITRHIAITLASTLMCACGTSPTNIHRRHEQAPIYPEYDSITVPRNIAPLNFMVRGAQAVYAIARCGDDSIIASGADARFELDQWRRMLESHAGHELSVRVIAKSNGAWEEYDPLTWTISTDTIDRYMTYRLIEPGYEVWNKIKLCSRDLSTYEETTIIDNSNIEGSCLNCHISNKNRPQMMFHLRGEGGGTLIATDGKLRKVNLRTESMPSGAVYGDFHPSGRYAVFSNNTIIPGLHSQGSKRLEVYDEQSDVFVVDLDRNEAIMAPWLADSTQFETFPVFSSDGASIYFCTAPAIALPDSIRKLRYSLCRADFDARTGCIGNQVDTLRRAAAIGGSVCHPKASPDGQWLMYTVADYGTFPIWHAETDLEMMHVPTGLIADLSLVNSDKSDTYHSWSANSRWVAFASKRGDGQYGKPYIAHIGSDGTASRAFVVPQYHPRHYLYILKSYNIPDLSPYPTTFTPEEVKRLRSESAAEPISD